VVTCKSKIYEKLFFDTKRSILESHMFAMAFSASFRRYWVLCSTFKADLKI
jgi:hypothetical protein